MLFADGSLLDRRYRVEDQIGAGGYSQVWRATDTVLDRQVAIKLLLPGYAGNDDAVARFRDEARHAGALTQQNIARIYDFGEAGQGHPPYLVMELVDGPAVADLLADGPMDAAQVMDVVAQTAAGLQAAHAAGLVHRDVKPGNLLIDPTGALKITDFGIAHAVGSAPITGTGLVVGTPGYLAPERAAGAQATPASDLYALGMVAYECLAGAAPFSGTAVEVALAHRDQPLPPLPAAVPANVASLVAQLTAKDPADRPRNAETVASHARWLHDDIRAHQAATASEPAATRRIGALGGEAAAAAGAVGAASFVGAGGVASGPNRPTLGLPPVPPQGPPGRRGRIGANVSQSRRSAYATAALASLGLVGLVLASIFLPGLIHSPQHRPGTSQTGKSGSAVLAVDINAAALIGEPVKVAAQQLHQEGMIVAISWQQSDQPDRTVISVQPSGRLPRGSVVTLIAAAPHHGHGHGHGNGDGNGNGNGN